MTITLTDLKVAKQKLDEDIFKLVAAFENKFDVTVENIDVASIRSFATRELRTHYVKTQIKVDI